jgi:hypothetical protein
MCCSIIAQTSTNPPELLCWSPSKHTWLHSKQMQNHLQLAALTLAGDQKMQTWSLSAWHETSKLYKIPRIHADNESFYCLQSKWNPADCVSSHEPWTFETGIIPTQNPILVTRGKTSKTLYTSALAFWNEKD